MELFHKLNNYKGSLYLNINKRLQCYVSVYVRVQEINLAFKHNSQYMKIIEHINIVCTSFYNPELRGLYQGFT